MTINKWGGSYSTILFINNLDMFAIAFLSMFLVWKMQQDHHLKKSDNSTGPF